MGKTPKMEVTDYFMSQHLGWCSGADEMTEILIGEKVAWKGLAYTPQVLRITDKKKLFGGDKKEGGVGGSIMFLPGSPTQKLPDFLAQKLGRENSDDCPGYRGLTSTFFYGRGTVEAAYTLPEAFAAIFSGTGSAERGFYWGSNTPYLKNVWARMRRAPKGLNQSYARVPRPGSAQYPSVSIDSPIVSGGWFTASSVGGWMVYYGGNGTLWWFNIHTFEYVTITNPVAFSSSVKGVTLDRNGTAWFTGVGVGVTLYYANPGDAYPTPALITDANSIFMRNTRAFDVNDDGNISVISTYLTAAGWIEGTQGRDYVDSARDSCVNSNGDILVLCQPTGASDQFSIVKVNYLDIVLPPEVLGTYTAAVGRGAPTEATMCHAELYGHYFVWMDDYVYLIDDETFAIKDTIPLAVDMTWQHMPVDDPYLSDFWVEYDQLSLEDASIMRTVNPALWTIGGSRETYDRYNHSIWCVNGSEVYVRLLDRGAFDANPSHIIYESLTNTDWGIGESPALIDVDSFEDNAVTLYNEQTGLSLIWTGQTTVEDFVTEILDHIQATIFVNPRTGLLTLKLIRGDYDVSTLRHITIDNADLSNFQRKAWGEITNEIAVTWTNPLNEEEETITVQDLGAIAVQGKPIADSRNYYGLRSKEKAVEFGARDLRASSFPLASCDVELDRTAWDLLPGEVVKVTWAEHGLSEVVFRVGPVDYGRPGEPAIKASLVEDVFSLTTATYTVPPSSEWNGEAQEPDTMDFSRVITLPAYPVAGILAELGSDAVYPEVFAGILASTENTDAMSYDLAGYLTVNSTEQLVNFGEKDILGRATLDAALTPEAVSTGVKFNDRIGRVYPGANVFAFIGNDDMAEGDMEVALITGGSTSSGFTLRRGCLDTVPKEWDPDTVVWFAALDTDMSDNQLRAEGETARFQLFTRTSLGVLQAAPTISAVLTDRPHLPNRPANVQVDGVSFNDALTPVNMTTRPDPWVTVSWANRNRLLEDSVVYAWTDGTMPPEDGQTTTIEVWSADGLTLLDTISGLTGTSYDVPDASFGTAGVVRMVVKSERVDDDGTFECLQAHGIYVMVEGGYGLGYGLNYGGA